MATAIYSRKSKYTGKGESIENQVELCRQYAAAHLDRNTMDEFLVYEDEGFSGKTMERPQFQKLLRDARQGRFRTLICYRLDRISRSVVDFSALAELFRSLGIDLICIREQFDTSTPMGRAMMYIASVFAQLERETIAERVRDNMMLLARDGRWLGGTPPTGYRCTKASDVILEGKKKTSFLLADDEAERSAVRLLFQTYQQSGSLRTACDAMAANGCLTRNGNPYSVPTVRAILANPVYCAADSDAHRYFTANGSEVCFSPGPDGKTGLLCYHKRTGTAGTERRCGVSEWIIAQGTHTAAVSGADWIAVQERLGAGGAPNKRSARNPYALLSGLLFCGTCGAPLYAKPRSGRGREFDYICRSKLRSGHGGCPSGNLNGFLADQAIRAHFTFAPLAKELAVHLRSLLPEAGGQTSRGIGAEISRLVGLIAQSPPDDRSVPYLQERINALDREREALQNTAASIGEAPAFPDSPETLFAALPERTQRELLTLLVERAEYKDGALSLRAKPGCAAFFTQE